MKLKNVVVIGTLTLMLGALAFVPTQPTKPSYEHEVDALIAEYHLTDHRAQAFKQEMLKWVHDVHCEEMPWRLRAHAHALLATDTTQ